MNAQPNSIIDVNKTFQHLPGAPIVEAVIHWRAHSQTPLQDQFVKRLLESKFSDYKCEEQAEIDAALQASSGNVEMRHQTHWNGFRLTSRSETDRYIAQITPHGVVFSRLAKYDCWDTFQTEALRFWNVYVDLGRPNLVERLGVRFINQIQLGPADTPGTFLRHLPAPPPGLPLKSEHFFHQDSFIVRDQPYCVNSVRTAPAGRRVLIVDTDVAFEPKCLLGEDALLSRLAEMRYLKNELFFAYMTDQALDEFGRAVHG